MAFKWLLLWGVALWVVGLAASAIGATWVIYLSERAHLSMR